MPSIFKKTLNLPYSVAKDSAAATLMSTDIEGISTGIPKLHDIWSGFIEVIVGLYILSTIIDKATFLVVLPVLSKKSPIFYHATLLTILISLRYPLVFSRKILCQKFRRVECKDPRTRGLDDENAFASQDYKDDWLRRGHNREDKRVSRRRN